MSSTKNSKTIEKKKDDLYEDIPEEGISIGYLENYFSYKGIHGMSK